MPAPHIGVPEFNSPLWLLTPAPAEVDPGKQQAVMAQVVEFVPSLGHSGLEVDLN